MTRSYRKPGL